VLAVLVVVFLIRLPRTGLAAGQPPQAAQAQPAQAQPAQAEPVEARLVEARPAD
jgi:hypothetical protein